MVSSFAADLAAAPLTAVHCAAMTLLFVVQWNFDVPATTIGVHYDRVMEDGQWWRILTSAYSHSSIWHVGFNVWSLWIFGPLEAEVGSITYLRFSFVLLIASNLLMLLTTWILFRFFRQEAQRNTYTLGYSGVVFGWMSIAAILEPASSTILGLRIPAWVMPFLYAGVIQIFIPNASFVGHMSGIVVGFAIGGGVFAWFNDYLFLCAVIWTLFAVLVSLKLTTDLPLGWIQIIDPDAPVERVRRVVNGVLMYDDEQPLAAPEGAAPVPPPPLEDYQAANRADEAL